ncbi:unnamed protein product, partial [Ilex paraguariensis]
MTTCLSSLIVADHEAIVTKVLSRSSIVLSISSGNIRSSSDKSTTAPCDFGSYVDPVITSDPPESSSMNLSVDLFPYFPSDVGNVSSSSDNSTTAPYDSRLSMDPIIKSNPPKPSSTFDVYYSNR